MRLNVKNFENEERKITWKINGMFLNVFYFKKELGFETFDRFFFCTLQPGDDTRTKLIELFQKVEKHYGIELLQPEFKIEPYNLN